MEVNNIKASVRDRRIYLQEYVSPTAGNVEHDTLEITLDDEWSGLDKRVTFYRESNENCREHTHESMEFTLSWDGQSAITIPWEVLREPGSFAFTVVGSEDGTDRLVTVAMPKYDRIKVSRNGEDEGVEPSEPTEDVIRRIDNVAADLEAKVASGYFKGDKGDPGTPGVPGAPGQAGAPGFSPSAKVEQTASGAKVTITDKDGTTTASISNGEPGQPGTPGQPGFSPTANVQRTEGGAVITITDESGTTTAEVLDGQGGGGAVQDVQVAGTSVLVDGVANVPVGGQGRIGVVKPWYSNLLSGIDFRSDGSISTFPAELPNIDGRKFDCQPITTKNFDYAVKAALCDGKGAVYTDAEKLAARERFGIVTITTEDYALLESKDPNTIYFVVGD